MTTMREVKKIWSAVNRIELSLSRLYKAHRVKTKPARVALKALSKEIEAVMAALEEKGIPMSGPSLPQEHPPASP